MHVDASLSIPSAISQQIWLANSGETSHMTADRNNLSLASPFPFNETIQTVAGDAGLSISRIGSSMIHITIKPLRLNLVIYVPRLT